MNEQIVIKYKEETLLKSEMTEREKAIWDDGYKEGYVTKQKENDGLRISLGLGCVVIVVMVIHYFFYV